MKVEAKIEIKRQDVRTDIISKYTLSIEAIGSMKECDELMDWVTKFGEKKQMKDYKEWKLNK